MRLGTGRTIRRWAILAAFWLCQLAATIAWAGETIRVATYNVRNYLSMDRLVEGQYRLDYPKPESEKSVVRQTILSVSPDVLTLQEIGSEEYLRELRDDLAREGLVYEGMAIVMGADEVRHVAALWKSSLTIEARSHTDLEFRLFDEPQVVKRGMLELRIQNPDRETVASVFVLHLKSKYTDDKRDPESHMRRTGEAEACRERILEIYPEPDEARYLILGDLNDGPDAAAVRRFLTKGPRTLSVHLVQEDRHGLRWTHDYRKAAEYAQIDHMLVSPGWAEMNGARATIVDRPDYYEGSDHRLVWVDLALP